jgi:hypothetical protein
MTVLVLKRSIPAAQQAGSSLCPGALPAASPATLQAAAGSFGGRIPFYGTSPWTGSGHLWWGACSCRRISPILYYGYKNDLKWVWTADLASVTWASVPSTADLVWVAVAYAYAAYP